MAFIRPSFIDNMGWHMAEVYGAVTDRILINLARYFPFWKPGQSVPQSSFEYQANMLAQMGQVTTDTIKIIRSMLGGADDALTNILQQAIMEAVKKSQPDLLKAVQAGLLNPTKRPVVDPSQMRAFDMYYQQAAQKLNMVNTVMLESTKQAYQATVADIAARVQVTQNALDIGAAETVTGVSSWNQALRHSIERMKNNGITGFIDHAGHKWSAEAYTAMDIRTTVANTARAAVWETNQDFGNDLYIVSYHDGARPLCYPWQNKVISASDRGGTTTDLDGNEVEIIPQNRTSYGEHAGLFGINCKHYPSPFIPGVSVLYDQSNIMSEKENEKVYEQTQQQRALERQIREQKRDLLMAKNMGASKDELNALRAKIRETDDEIDAFCADTGLPRRQSREGVFTARSFPPEDTYDVDTFERTQKEAIDKYFNDGGSQQGYTFGQMTPNETPVQTPPVQMPPQMPAPQVEQNPDVVTFTPAKTQEEAERYAMEHFGNKYTQVSYKGIDLEYANTCNRVLTEVYDKFDIEQHTKWANIGGIEPMNMRSKLFKGSTAEAAYQWSGDGKLYINPTYYKSTKAFLAHKTEIDNLTKTCLEGGQGILDSGKYTGKQRTWLETLLRTGRQCVSQSHDFVEGSFVHESGHMLEDKVFRKVYDTYFGTAGKFEGAGKYLAESMEKYGVNISAYAVSSVREYVAESFTAFWYGEISILDPNIIKVFEGVMKQ